MRSDALVPAVLTWSPTSQVVHGAQEAAFVDVLNVPLAHALQTRSVVEVGWPATYVPAAQTVSAVQT